MMLEDSRLAQLTRPERHPKAPAEEHICLIGENVHIIGLHLLQSVWYGVILHELNFQIINELCCGRTGCHCFFHYPADKPVGTGQLINTMQGLLYVRSEMRVTGYLLSRAREESEMTGWHRAGRGNWLSSDRYGRNCGLRHSLTAIMFFGRSRTKTTCTVRKADCVGRSA